MSIATVSVVTRPDQFSPINTDGLWFELQSASFSSPGFNYIVDLYSWDTDSSSATQSLGRQRLPPRPDTGNGVFTPHKILKSQVTNSPRSPIYIAGVTQSIGSFEKYWFDYGFQVDPELSFVNTFKGTFSSAPTIGYLGLSFSSSTDLKVGDQILLIMNNQKENPSYNGAAIIASVSNSTKYITDIPYGVTPSAAESGFITNLIRLTGTTDESYTSATAGNYTWNGTRQYKQKYVNFGPRYVLKNNNQSFLTTYTYSTAKPAYMKTIYWDQYDDSSFLLNGDDQSISSIGLSGYDRYDNRIVSATYSIPVIDYKGRFDIGVGVPNLQPIFPSVDFTLISWYKVSLFGTQLGYILSPIDWQLHLVNGSTSSYTEWDPYASYVVNQVVLYNNLVYFNITGGNNQYRTPEYDSTNWTFEGGGPVFNWSSLSTYSPGDLSLFNNNIYENLTGSNSYSTFSFTGAVGNVSRQIDTTCTVYPIVQLRFLNEIGGYDTWNFIRNNKKTTNIERTEWRQQLPWDYNVGDRQQSVLSTRAQDSYFANTDFLSQYDYEYLSQLVKSPEVYRVDGTYSIPVVITDDKWVEKTYLEEQIFSLTISFKDSFNIITQDQ